MCVDVGENNGGRNRRAPSVGFGPVWLSSFVLTMLVSHPPPPNHHANAQRPRALSDDATAVATGEAGRRWASKRGQRAGFVCVVLFYSIIKGRRPPSSQHAKGGKANRPNNAAALFFFFFFAYFRSHVKLAFGFGPSIKSTAEVWWWEHRLP